jgi:hypothetical protein
MDPQAYVKETKQLRPRSLPTVSESSTEDVSTEVLRGA